MKCLMCNKQAQKYSQYASGRFCSKTCGTKFSSASGNDKTKQAMCLRCDKEITIHLRCSIKSAYCTNCTRRMIKERAARQYRRKRILKYNHKCKFCGKNLENIHRQICDECKIKYYNCYRLECNFEFDVYKYPKEFDLNLIKNFGWYKASNRGNNLDGVVKDHVFSINDGFKLNINPDVIKHPANCNLTTQPQNNKKSFHSHITLLELFDKIKLFEKKYNYNKNIIKEINRLSVGPER